MGCFMKTNTLQNQATDEPKVKRINTAHTLLTMLVKCAFKERYRDQ